MNYLSKFNNIYSRCVRRISSLKSKCVIMITLLWQKNKKLMKNCNLNLICNFYAYLLQLHYSFFILIIIMFCDLIVWLIFLKYSLTFYDTIYYYYKLTFLLALYIKFYQNHFSCLLCCQFQILFLISSAHRSVTSSLFLYITFLLLSIIGFFSW